MDEFSYFDLAHFGQSVGAKLIDDGQQHLVTGDVTEMNPAQTQ